MRKTIAVLGASGSVGTQALDVARARGYNIELLSANRDVSFMEEAAREFNVKYAAMADEKSAMELKARLSDTSTKVLVGPEGILEGIRSLKECTVVNSILGEAGLMPTLTAIESGHRLALANKESLVIAGDIVMEAARRFGTEIIPVDSEHSAIFQSLKCGKGSEIKRILLTASGGPFFGKSREELREVTLADTLAHPTWKMGKKITVDSATLMNKGFEIIEAVHLFGTPAEKVEVVIHRESILHSAVEYIDNTVIGEFSVPDMRACVQYAVDYPDRCEAVIDELDLFKLSKMTFYKPDTEAFPLLGLAKRAISLGGAVPATVNAADEVAVAAFLEERISFAEISDIVEDTADLLSREAKKATTLEDIIGFDREARNRAKRKVNLAFQSKR